MNPIKCIMTYLFPEPPMEPPLVTREQIERAREYQKASGYSVPPRPLVGFPSKTQVEPFEGRPDVVINGETWRWIDGRTLCNLTPPKRTCPYCVPENDDNG